MRQDVTKTKQNSAHDTKFRKAVKTALKGAGKDAKKTISSAYSAIDKAAKKNIIHKNKASRLKAQISKLVSKK